MNTWSNTVLTDKGRALLAKLTQGNTLNITKAMTGSGFVTPGFLAKQTEITDPKQTLNFRPVSYPETGKCALPMALTNEGLVTGYTATQVGIYATDPDEGEILFFISQAADAEKGTIIPGETEMPGYAAEWTFYLAYGQADKVEVTVDQAGAISRAEFEEKMKKFATLDDDGKVPEEQLPDTTYIPVTSEVPSDSDIWIDPDETAIEESHVSNRNNPHGVTAAQIGAAPAGFGLGINSGSTGSPVRFSKATDLDNLTNNGFWTYYKKSTPLDSSCAETDSVYGGTITGVSGTVTQIAVTAQTGVWIVRHKKSGVWTPWAYINPPMAIGVEYLTTELWNGKNVYTIKKTYDVVSVTAGVYPMVNIYKGATPYTLVRKHSNIVNGESSRTPVSNDENVTQKYVKIGSFGGNYQINYDLPLLEDDVGGTAHLQVWYVKDEEV